MTRAPSFLVSVLLICPALVLASLVPIGTPAAAAPRDLVCRGHHDGGSFRHVVIPHRARCVIKDARITGNVRTRGKPRVVRILDTPIKRNVKIRRVTRRVVIGAAGCRVDPVAGRNLMVRSSRNVAICQMSVANNLMLRNNRGRVMVRDNRVCNNIRVSRNDVIAIRVIRNRYAGRLSVSRNDISQRRVVEVNRELRGSPGTCRR